VLRIGVKPSLLAGVVGALPTASVAAGLGTGVATVSVAPDAVAAAHAAVHAAGGTSMLRARPAGSDAPAWGPPPSALAVLTALKTVLDPDGRLGPGRFAPWM
jgi:glycolate oxidase FAD binding subunit